MEREAAELLSTAETVPGVRPTWRATSLRVTTFSLDAFARLELGVTAALCAAELYLKWSGRSTGCGVEGVSGKLKMGFWAKESLEGKKYSEGWAIKIWN